MSIVVPGLPADLRVPGTYFVVVVGGKGTSAGVASKRILLAGSKITTTLTGASPSFTVTAGTQADAAPIAVRNEDQAALYFGRGSELHLMVRAVLAQAPTADITCVAVAESGGSRATGVLTFATTATGAFTIRLFVDGLVIEVAVATGDTATVIATAVANAILQRPDLPLTAQFAAGVVTFRAKHPGLDGNEIFVGAQFVPSTGAPVEITTGSVNSGSGTTGIFSGVTVSESTYSLSGGTTVQDVTAALAAITPVTYHRQVWATVDSTNLPLITAKLTAMAAATSQRRQQAIVATAGALGGATAIAATVNDPRLQVVWHYNSAKTPPQVAACFAAGRLYGDGVAGGVIRGELARPNSKLAGLKLVGIQAQRFVAEQPTFDELQAAASAGVTVLVPDGSRPGLARAKNCITSRSSANGSPNYSVLDTAFQSTPDDLADDLQSYLDSEIEDLTLVTEADGSAFPEISGTTTVSRVRGMVKGRLKTRERDGWIRNVDARDAELVAEESSTLPGQINMEIPCEVAPPLNILAGTVRNRS